MTDPPAPASSARPALDALPVLVVGMRQAIRMDPAGAPQTLSLAAAAERLGAAPHLLCNLPLALRRLGLARAIAVDLLELYAFVRPARFLVPTPAGLLQALGLAADGAGPAAIAPALYQAAGLLLDELRQMPAAERKDAAAIAQAMARAGWPWGEMVIAALDADTLAGGSLATWNALPEWEEGAPPPPPHDHPVSEAEADARLLALLGPDAEPRPQQRAYARAASVAFRPRARPKAPNMILLEAGTGIGKTLGYIAPASLWAEKNGGSVWLSTFTRNLQRQLDAEIARLYPDPDMRARAAVIRKGRENYACLLNVEEAARGALAGVATVRDAIMMGLVLRWLGHSRDGDLAGGDFPNWLGGIFGRGRLAALSDHRGECLYAACPHYRRCFIERGIRQARQARLVVANHALVMARAVRRRDDGEPLRRLVFDEGHHLFEAADSAFSAHLTGTEGAELRRWLRGRETASRGRARGLLTRLEDLLSRDDSGWTLLHEVLDAARALPGPGWQRRLGHLEPQGPFEVFLSHVRTTVLARARNTHLPHSLECGTEAPEPRLVEAAETLKGRLDGLARPVATLAGRLAAFLDAHAETLDSGSRGRLEAAIRSLTLRAELIALWCDMLAAIGATSGEDVVDWFELSRSDGRERDVGLHRHAIDPTVPFAAAVLAPAHGVVITSATLMDRHAAEEEADWHRAETRVGARHLVEPPQRLSLASPFDYARQTRVLIVTDVRKNDPDRLAAAYRALMLAAGGGALGLFTAIARLRATHARIAPALEAAGLPLYAQHVDPIDTGTLVDIFRAEHDACLLGTDAVRDGVDVPGDALRLIVFDRVPWPRPNILHKARRAAFGGAVYDDMLARLRLAQAFGRLIRRASDRGVFVLLDAQTPTRLLPAFPPGVVPARVGLSEAVACIGEFLARNGHRGVSVRD